ncbi:MAG TPA: DNA mismatch repair endonuclease MutL, partial [bacterium]|nr:DNA mismatch repair endonuclease MutL [bacterium]
PQAVQVQIDGGTTTETGPAAGPPGTTVLVSDLFYNLPARKKFLKRPTTEMEHVCSAVTWLALAHEKVHFTLVHNGRSVMELPAVASRAERIMSIYGRGIMGDLLPVALDTPALSVSGFMSRPTVTRNSAQHIFTFVNDRYIRNRTIQRALMDGYRNILPTGRYPLVFLYLDLDPRTIDINVHPTKQEVKFARENEVFTAVYGAVRQAWEQRPEEKHPPKPAARDHYLSPQLSRSPVPRNAIETAKELYRPDPGPAHSPTKTASKTSLPKIGRDTDLRPSPPKIGGDTEGVEYIVPTSGVAEGADTASKPSPPKIGEDTEGVDFIFPIPAIPPDLLRVSSVDEAPELRVLGQLANSYILAESNGALFIIDQHAAHERILFERFLAHSARGPLASQILLFPATIDLSPAEMPVLLESQDIFHRLGFDLEPFGLSTYAVRAIPGDLNMEAASELVRDMVTALQGEGNIEEKVERALHTLACRAAVKFGDPLDRDSMEAIANNLRSIPRRDFCPHGRPSIVCLSLETLRKAFRRT